jgi:heme exporter protein D
MTHFLAMGGYAAYVWPAYGATALGLIGAVAFTLRGYMRAKKLLASAQSRETRP